MADIKYTPSELLAQSAEMTALQSEYDALFVKTTNALNGLNESWSANLSKNFSGKIQSAQKSFSSILNMLTNGSMAAKLGATSHSPTSIETFLKSLDAMDKPDAAGLDQMFSNLTDEDKQRLYDALPSEVKAAIKTSQDVDKWLSKNYESIPEPVRKVIEEKLPSQIKDPLAVAHEVISGEADFSTVGKAVTIGTGDPLMGNVVTSVMESTYNSKLDKFHDQAELSEEKAYNSFKSGDVGSGILYTLEAMGHETRAEGYALIDTYTNMVGNVMKATDLPVIRELGSAIHGWL